MIDAISFNLPGDNGNDFHDADWNIVDAKLANLPVLRLFSGATSARKGSRTHLAMLYFVEDKTAFLRGRYHYSAVTVFNDLQPFGEKTVARKLTILGSSAGKIEIAIDTLEPAGKRGEKMFFRMEGVKPALYVRRGG